MTAQHTRGRLNYKASGRGFYHTLIVAPNIGHVGDFTEVARGLLRADARRLAACWNALEGVPTEEIEGFMAHMAEVREHIGVVGRLHIGRQDELAAARALLADVIAPPKTSIIGPRRAAAQIADRIRTFLEPKP